MTARLAFRVSASLVAVGIVVNIVSALLGAAYDRGWQARERAPVCWAVTEDSKIRGCDYRAGAWWVDR